MIYDLGERRKEINLYSSYSYDFLHSIFISDKVVQPDKRKIVNVNVEM